MNHQPFESWLLDEEPLTSQQQRELENHLRSCTACSGIAGSNLALHSAHLAAPAPGFPDRFGSRLAAWQRQQQRRQALGTILLVLLGMGLLYALAGPGMLQAARAPAVWLGQITAYAIELLALLSVISHVGGILLRNAPVILPPADWPVMILASGALAAVWIASMRRLARAPQGVGQ